LIAIDCAKHIERYPPLPADHTNGLAA